MKKNFLFVLLSIVAMLTSCNKEEVGGLATNQATSFNVSVDGGVQTRAVSEPVTDLTRFVMEVYKGPTATGTPVKHIEQATGRFTDILLDDKQAYTVVFWADYGKLGTDSTNNPANDYNASDLKAARVVAGKQPTKAAYSGVSKFTVGTDPETIYTNVTLTHSVAQVNFEQKEALTAAKNKLTVSYPKSYSVNVGDGSVTEIVGAIEHSFTYKKTEAGTLGTSYIIAAKGASKTVLDITATLNSEPSKTVSNVPFARNFKTNISGAYSNKYNANLTVTCDDVWGTPENEVKLPVKVGDFYYKNKTFSSTYIADAQNPCIGIVFVVNADGKTGKIVSLDEKEKGVWSTENIVTGATSKTDGAENTKKILALGTYSESVYPAVGWCVAKNANVIEGIYWYLPADQELRQLYAAMSGLKLVASGAGEGEIKDWGYAVEMPNYDKFLPNRILFNEKFTTAKGKTIGLTAAYYSSSAYSLNEQSNAYSFLTEVGTFFALGKQDKNSFVRAVSAF